MGLWHKLLGVEQKIVSAAEISRIFNMHGGDPPRRGTAELIESYCTLGRFRGVVNRTATSLACTRWHFFRAKQGKLARRDISDEISQRSWKTRAKTIKEYSDKGDLEEIVDHPMIDALHRATPEHTARQRRILRWIWMDIVGEAFEIIERGAKGEPFEFWPIPPHWVTKTPSADLSYYEVQGQQSGTRQIPRQDMVWYRDPSPVNPYGRGSGFGHALSSELDIEEYSSKTQTARFWNQAIPSLLIAIEDADDKELLRFQKRFEDEHRSWKRAYRPHMTSSGKIHVEKLDTTFTDLQMIEGREFEGRVIQQTYGVPPEILGMNENSNRSTIDAADFLNAVFVLTPRLDFEEDMINNRIAPLFGDDVMALYESPVPENWEIITKHMKDHPYAFSIDELREVIDYDPIETGDGTLHPIKAGWVFDHISTEAGNLMNPNAPQNQNEEGDQNGERDD